MLDKNTKNLVLSTLIGKTSLKDFEKYIYSLSLEEGGKIFGDKIFLELLEYDYSDDVISEKFEKICLKILDISDILAEYLIFLMEKFLQKNDDFDWIFYELFDWIFYELYEYYSGGFGFLLPFEVYYSLEELGVRIERNNEIIDEICEKIPEIIENLQSGKIYNLTFDDEDFQKYGFIAGSIFSPFSRRFTYDER